MAKYFIEDTTLESMADTIRSLTGSTAPLTPSEMTAGVQEAKEDVDSAMDALETLGVEVPEGSDVGDLAGLVGEVEVGGGGVSVPAKEVNFYDYDGTRLYSYTIEEVQRLTELPPLPEQKGLICQEWNYDLDTIKSYGREVDIGATYITDDGKTRLYISSEGLRHDICLYFMQSVSNGVVVEWGDNSPSETIDGTGHVNISHVYSTAGDYVITLTAMNGCEIFLGNGDDSSTTEIPIFGEASEYSHTARTSNKLKKVEIGYGVTKLGRGAFRYCQKLKSITIPSGTDYNNISTFRDTGIICLVLPRDISNFMNGSACYDCEALERIIQPHNTTQVVYKSVRTNTSAITVVLPDKITYLGEETFGFCYALEKVVMPTKLTDIAAKVFTYCYALKCIDFSHTTQVPTLANINALYRVPSDCEIRVPSNLYDKWKAATNWSNYADYIVAV